jgi:mannose-1-phosphate guanylyltransferase
MEIKVVIVAGGRGQRFWPVSRKSTPKQILALFGDKPLIQLTIDRVLPLVSLDNIYISTGVDLQEQIMSISSDITQYITEPMPKDTAAAIGFSAVKLCKDSQDAIMIVLPSDHYIQNQQKNSMKNLNLKQQKNLSRKDISGTQACLSGNAVQY